MKVLLIVLVGLVAFTSARPRKNLMDSVTSMLQTNQSPTGGAAGAFETVLEYIETLKQQAIEDLAAAEQKRERDANTCAANKAAMQNIIEEKQTNLDDVTEHLTWLNGEFADAEARVAFVQARILAIKTKYDNLKKQSCASNFLFVQDLKEHKDAMDLLQILEEEINSYFSQKSQQSLVQVQKVQTLAGKLESFSRLFNKNGQQVLAQVPQTWDTLTDQTEIRTDAEVGTGHEDNDQSALVANDVPRVEDMDKFQGTLQDKMIRLIQQLRDHLNGSRQDLIDNNINAATDFAQFIRDMEDEVEDLRHEVERKKAYTVKLSVDIQAATSSQANAQIELDTAIKTLSDETARCEKLDAANATRIAEIKDEIDIIGQVETLFHERIASIKGYVKQRADEHNTSGEFETANMKERVVQKNEALKEQDYTPYI